MKMSETEFERQYAAATRSGEEELRTHPLAIAVEYSRRLRKVRVSLNNGCLFVFPPELVQGLASATPKQLAEVRILSPGAAIDWPTLDVQCQITSLLSGIFGTRRWMADLGRKGGQAKSPAKTAAARENGKKGGRRSKRQATARGGSS